MIDGFSSSLAVWDRNGAVNDKNSKRLMWEDSTDPTLADRGNENVKKCACVLLFMINITIKV